MHTKLLTYGVISGAAVIATATALPALPLAPPASADATQMALVNDTGCPNPLQESGALAGAAQTHNSYLSKQRIA